MSDGGVIMNDENRESTEQDDVTAQGENKSHS